MRADDRRPDLAIAIGACRTTGMWMEIVAAVSAGAAELGWRPHVVADLDQVGKKQALVLGVSPWPVGPQAMASHRGRIGWYAEPLPPASGRRVGRLLAAVPSARLADIVLDRLDGRDTSLVPRLVVLRERAAAERELRRTTRELRGLARIATSVVVTSEDRRQSALRLGIPARRVAFGYHERHAGPLTPVRAVQRDLPVVVLGRDTSGRTRRARILARSIEELARPLRPTIVAGVYQRDRHELLRRAKVVLDVQRVPGNFTGLRLVLAIAAGAVMISEPMLDPTPFVAGTHFVESEADDLARTVTAVVADEPWRKRIVEAGQELLASTLTMARSVEEVLAR